jgi:hypothetical protein
MVIIPNINLFVDFWSNGCSPKSESTARRSLQPRAEAGHRVIALPKDSIGGCSELLAQDAARHSSRSYWMAAEKGVDELLRTAGHTNPRTPDKL